MHVRALAKCHCTIADLELLTAVETLRASTLSCMSFERLIFWWGAGATKVRRTGVMESP